MSSHNRNLNSLDQRPSHEATTTICQPVATTCNGLPAQKGGNSAEAALLHEELKIYETYLNDYDYCRKERLRRNVMDKYNLIMQSVKNKSKDQFPCDVDEDDLKDARDKMVVYGIARSPATSSASNCTKLSPDFFACYKKILKRHSKRLSGERIA